MLGGFPFLNYLLGDEANDGSGTGGGHAGGGNRREQPTKYLALRPVAGCSAHRHPTAVAVQQAHQLRGRRAERRGHEPAQH